MSLAWRSQIRKKSEARNLKSKTPAKAHSSKRRNATVQRLMALSDFDIRISDLRRTPRYFLGRSHVSPRL